MTESVTPVTAATAPPVEVTAVLAELRRRFAEQLAGRMTGVREQMQRLLADRADGADGHEVDLGWLHREVHGLAGSGGTFGLPEVSVAARALETPLAMLLRAEVQLDAALAMTLQEAFQALERATQTKEESGVVESWAPNRDTANGESVTVYCHLDAAVLPRDCAEALGRAGYRVHPVPDLAQLGTRPSGAVDVPVLLLDVQDEGAVQNVLEQVRRLTEADPRWRVLAALPGEGLAQRLAATRAGVQRTLAHPLQCDRLIEQLDALTGRRPQEPFRVLLVDDEPLLLEAQAAVLQGAGMQVQAITDPLQTLDALEGFRPDVLVLDVYMPSASGPELAAVLREREAWLDLPVLFLSAETDLTQQLLALNLGGDDFLVKPVQPAHLVAAVTARARRARQNSALRRRLQTSLYEREREHLALDQHAIVSVADPAGRILYANDLFCRVSGYTLAEVRLLTHQAMRADVHPRGFIGAIREAVFGGQVWQGEVCCKRRDGSLYWTETTITPFFDEGGRLYQYVVIQTDISHIKATEAALRQQRDMQRVISLSAARLMAAPLGETDRAIRDVLQSSGSRLQADRAYLYTFARDGRRFSGEHVWCAPGVPPMPSGLERVSPDHLPWLESRLSGDRVFQLPDVDQLGPGDAPQRTLLLQCGVRSLLIFALQQEGHPIGFLAYSVHSQARHWSEEEITQLKVLRDVIASALLRTRSDAALRKSESRLHFLVASSPVIIHASEPRPPFALHYVSPNVERLLGYAPQAFLDDPAMAASVVHPDDLRRVIDERTRQLQGGELLLEYRLRTDDGRYRWMQERSRMVRDGHGQALEVVGYWMDITERKRIEAELSSFNRDLERRVEEQTRSVLQTERLAQASLDALSARVLILNPEGHIVAANRAWREFAGGRTLEQIHDYLAYLEAGDAERGLKPLGALADGVRSVLSGTVRNFVLEYQYALGGEPRWYVARVERFATDESQRVVVSHEDITGLKVAERAQLRSQRLESLGTLAGGVAHDLNNALAPVLMGMSLLKEQFPEESKMFDMMQGSAQRGADMVRQLLTFARGMDGERVPVAPLPLLRELERLMKGSFPKNIQLQVDGEPNLAPVLGDATQLHQVLLNLCVNARDAMPAGGTLSLKAQMVDLDEAYARSIPDAKPGRYVALRVIDTGAGIPPEIQDRIFDPFFTTKPSDKGTGLGLSTVLGIVRSHGGFVQLYSQPGQGSQFTVYLPVALSDAQARTREGGARNADFDGQGGTVLFVDDEAAVREVGRTVLERLNCRPVLATDGADGLVQATAHREQLRAVITDLHMPHMDGLSFVRALRRSMPGIPVILASGRVDESVTGELQVLGVTRRLDKPFTQEQLARELHALLDS